MTVCRARVIAELPLPLASSSGVLEAIDIAVALEDALGITLPDAVLDPSRLQDGAGVETVLNQLSPLS